MIKKLMTRMRYAKKSENFQEIESIRKMFPQPVYGHEPKHRSQPAIKVVVDGEYKYIPRYEYFELLNKGMIDNR